MLKKFAIILSIALTVAFAPAIATAEIPAPKIAVVDLSKVMTNSVAIKDANKQLEAKRSEYQAQISTEEAGLKKSEEDLAKQKSILSKEALGAKQKQFIDQVNEVRKNVQIRKAKLDKAHREALVQVQIAIRDIVSALAEEQGFNVAVPTEPLIFAHKDLDISDEVLKRLNDKLPKVSLKFE